MYLTHQQKPIHYDKEVEFFCWTLQLLLSNLQKYGSIGDCWLPSFSICFFIDMELNVQRCRSKFFHSKYSIDCRLLQIYCQTAFRQWGEMRFTSKTPILTRDVAGGSFCSQTGASRFTPTLELEAGLALLTIIWLSKRKRPCFTHVCETISVVLRSNVLCLTSDNDTSSAELRRPDLGIFSQKSTKTYELLIVAYATLFKVLYTI